jgi:hypothetical protein
MSTSPEAVIDCLYICRALGDIAGGAGEVEIVNLGYLSALLAVYDGMPPSEWGYSFAATKSLAPFSYSLADAIQGLQQSGSIEDTYAGFKLTDLGERQLAMVTRLRRFEGRLAYIAAACQSITAIPLPVVTGSLVAEPQLLRAQELASSRPLLDDTGRRALISHFEALAAAVPRTGDLFVPAVVWLTYLARQLDMITQQFNEGE